MPRQHVELMEGPFIEQDVQSLPCRQLSLGMLSIDAFRSSTQQRLLFQLSQLLDLLVHVSLSMK
jgi:hypothetical protein